MLTETTISVWFRTSGAPMSSVIMPRTAGTTISLVWFTWASCLYCVVSSTCRYQSRPPSVTSSAAAITYRPNSRRRDLGIIDGLRSGADHGQWTAASPTATDAGSATGPWPGSGGSSRSSGRSSTSSRGAAGPRRSQPLPGLARLAVGGLRRSASSQPLPGLARLAVGGLRRRVEPALTRLSAPDRRRLMPVAVQPALTGLRPPVSRRLMTVAVEPCPYPARRAWRSAALRPACEPALTRALREAGRDRGPVGGEVELRGPAGPGQRAALGAVGAAGMREVELGGAAACQGQPGRC